MALGITITDNGNATVTVAVSGSGGAGAVWSGRFSGREGSLTGWSSLLSFTGDGSYTAGLSPGHYVFQGITASQFSTPAYGAVADPNGSLATQCRYAVRDRIQLLALANIGDRVYLRNEFQDVNVSYPCVMVIPLHEGAETPGPSGGTNLRSDWGHPLRVMVLDRKNPDSGDTITPTYETWRQQILRSFDRERLPAVPQVLETLVEPGPLMQAYTPDFNIVGTEITVRSVARQPRGFGT